MYFPKFRCYELPLDMTEVFALNAIVRLYNELKNEFNSAVYDLFEDYVKKYELPKYLKKLNVNQKVLKSKLKEKIKVFKIV